MRFILLDDSLLDAVNYKDIIIKIYVHEALFPFKPSTILIHMLILILLPNSNSLSNNCTRSGFNSPAFISFLLCFHQERRLRSSGMHLEGLRWLVSRKSMASCHFASQSSSWFIKDGKTEVVSSYLLFNQFQFHIVGNSVIVKLPETVWAIVYITPLDIIFFFFGPFWIYCL